jgi:hypothetical protein
MGDGAAVSGAPAVSGTPTQTSIAVTAVTNAGSTGQSVEYAISTSTTAPTSGWQSGTTFSGLTSGTTYYVYARTAANTNYNAGAAQRSAGITTAGAGTAPAITGAPAMTLTQGYAATSSEAFTITGTPDPTVTKESGNAAITWNAATLKLDIAAGLSTGTYPVTLRAANGVAPDATHTFTLTVDKPTSSGELQPAAPLRAYVTISGQLRIEGLTAGKPLSIFTAAGALVYNTIAEAEEADVPVKVSGVYIIRNDERVVKITIEN